MKPVSVQKVSAILKMAGFQRSDNDAWHPSRGYHVHKAYTGNVMVHLYNADSTQDNTQQLETYRKALETAGVKVRIERNTPTKRWDYLICEGIEEESK